MQRTHYELHTGVKGNGNTQYLVVQVDEAGNWLFTHRFDRKAEAEHWMKWA